jgi:hypothetical protein
VVHLLAHIRDLRVAQAVVAVGVGTRRFVQAQRRLHLIRRRARVQPPEDVEHMLGADGSGLQHQFGGHQHGVQTGGRHRCVAEMLEHELPHLMPAPEAFDGYAENPARVGAAQPLLGAVRAGWAHGLDAAVPEPGGRGGRGQDRGQPCPAERPRMPEHVDGSI